MKKIQIKLAMAIIAIMLITLITPIKVLGANEKAQNSDLQIVKTTENGTEQYIIYVKGGTEEFKYFLSNNANENLENELALNFEQSEKDDEGNHIALLNKRQAETSKYIYIKLGEEITVTPVDFSKAYGKSEMEKVASTTKRIATEPTEKILETTEDVNGVKTTVTVGGLKINAEKGNYYYTITKLPKEKYSELMRLAKILENEEEYNKLSKYEKIETETSFYDLYTTLKAEQKWEKVEDMKVLQPADSQIGDEYVVFLKEVDENGNEKIDDVKFMIASRKDDEGKDQTEEVKEVKRTSKLPITGDNIILFVILAVIILVATMIFIRMKKLQGKQSKH